MKKEESDLVMGFFFLIIIKKTPTHFFQLNIGILLAGKMRFFGNLAVMFMCRMRSILVA